MKLDPALGGFEIVVVDDGSPGSLEPLIAKWQDRLPIRLMVQARGGPSAARNSGAKMGRGHFLVFIDDDCVPEPGWLSALLRELKRRPDHLLAGPVLNGLPLNPYATTVQRIATYVYQYYQGGGNEQFFTSNNLGVSARRFHEIGGFDTMISGAEDKDFCDRWRNRNYNMARVPEAKVIHVPNLALRSFLQQQFNYGRGILAFRLIRRRRGPSRLVPEPFSFYWNLMLLPLRDNGRGRAWREFALIVASQLAILAGACWAAMFERPSKVSGGRT
jgi:glycosyltransferase involved in cell wall biosynthesis